MKKLKTLTQIIKSSFSSLRKNAKQTFLTLLGIVVGTGVLVLVLSLGQGLEQIIMKQLGSFSPNSIFVEVQVPPSSNASQLEALSIKTLGEKDRQDVLKLDGITHASGWFMTQGKVALGRENSTASVLGAHSGFNQAYFLPVGKGRFWTETEDQQAEKVVFLGHDLAAELREGQRGKESIIGEKIKINGRAFRVIGTAAEIDAAAGLNMNEMAFIPMKAGQETLWSDDYYQAVVLRMENPDDIDQLQWRIERTIRKNHSIADPNDDDFAVRTFGQIMDIVGSVVAGVNLLLGALAGISLLVGGVGIMNVMFVRVSEKTKEIGLKKSLGARPFHILFQFLFEALFLTLLGGILGVVFGGSLAYLISIAASGAGFGWDYSLPITAAALALGVSVFIGVLFGFTPAKKAAGLDPILALRSEA